MLLLSMMTGCTRRDMLAPLPANSGVYDADSAIHVASAGTDVGDSGRPNVR
jgi:hypothetical protein